MALGQPSIVTPNLLALKPLQQLADQTRERFKAVEAFAQEASNRASATGQARDIQTLQAQVAQLQQQLAQVISQLQQLVAAPAKADGGTMVFIELDGAPGEDGLTIPGPQGPQGEPGEVIVLAGDVDDDDDFYPPP